MATYVITTDQGQTTKRIEATDDTAATAAAEQWLRDGDWSYAAPHEVEVEAWVTPAGPGAVGWPVRVTVVGDGAGE